MVELRTEVPVKGVTGKEISDFMLNCTDEQYRRWWPGVHMAFHTVRRYPGDMENVTYFDEYVGRRRLKFTGIVVKADGDAEIVWRMKLLVMLPAWLSLRYTEEEGGVRVIHTLSAGYRGFGRFLDVFFRMYLSRSFENELNMHAHTEFPMLARMLSARG